jgi:hypothetical protein
MKGVVNGNLKLSGSVGKGDISVKGSVTLSGKGVTPSLGMGPGGGASASITTQVKSAGVPKGSGLSLDLTSSIPGQGGMGVNISHSVHSGGLSSTVSAGNVSGLSANATLTYTGETISWSTVISKTINYIQTVNDFLNN